MTQSKNYEVLYEQPLNRQKLHNFALINFPRKMTRWQIRYFSHRISVVSSPPFLFSDQKFSLFWGFFSSNVFYSELSTVTQLQTSNSCENGFEHVAICAIVFSMVHNKRTSLVSQCSKLQPDSTLGLLPAEQGLEDNAS